MKIEITLTHVTPAILALVQSLHEAHSRAADSELAEAREELKVFSTKLSESIDRHLGPALATAAQAEPADGSEPTPPAGLVDKPAEGAPKRTRRSRAQIKADEAAAKAAAGPVKTEEPAPLHTTEPAVGAADPSGDVGLGFLDDDPAPTTPAKVYTLAEIRALLTEYGQKNGQEKARGLMREHGKAEKLSDIPATNYAAIAAACGA